MMIKYDKENEDNKALKERLKLLWVGINYYQLVIKLVLQAKLLKLNICNYL